MITYLQAMRENNFYHLMETNRDGTPLRVRRNGKTQTWKTRFGHFRIPVKYGLKTYIDITHLNQHEWAVSSGDNKVDKVAAILQRK